MRMRPCNGSRYVRHTDDAREQTRRLTCIFYVNPDWEEADGGQLCLYLGHLGRMSLIGETAPRPPTIATITPLANRLVLFWSDARVPHEVLPAFKARYAVSVWYSDARGVRAAAASADLTAAASSPPAASADLTAAASSPPAASADLTAAASSPPRAVEAADDDPNRACVGRAQDSAFVVRALAGRGLGVVALRPIAAGECLVTESPLVCWRVGRRGGQALARLSELSELVAELDAESRATYADER